MDDETIGKAVVGTFRHNLQEGNRKYYDWVRTCLTVASGSLALLIALQDNFVPAWPHVLWCLQAAWGCFGLTIVAALIILKSESATCFASASQASSPQFTQMLQRGNAAEIGAYSVPPAWYYRVFYWIFPIAFALSFVLLTVFAIANVSVHSPT